MEAETLTLRDVTAAPIVTAAQPAEAQAVQKTAAIAESISNVHSEVAKFDQINAGLIAIEKAHPLNVIVDAIDTPAGMRNAETAWRAYRNPRLEVERARKSAKAPVLALGRAIDTFAGSLEDRLLKGESHYKAQITAEEDRRAAVKAEAERKERERVDGLKAGILKLRGYVERAAGQPSANILKAVEVLSALEFLPADWQEFQDEARAARDDTVARLRELHGKAVEAEAQAAEAERLRLLAEAQAAELTALRAREAEREAAERAAREDAERRAAEASAAAEDAAAIAAPPVAVPAPAETPPQREPVPVHVAEAFSPAQQVQMLKLGDLCAKLGGLPLRADFIEQALGIHYAKKQGPAIYYTMDQAREIRKALVAMLRGVEL